MNRFIEAFRNLFRIPDLRNRVLFTLALLAVYRIGAHIPTPGINIAELTRLFEQGQGSVLGIFDLFSGGNLRKLTIVLSVIQSTTIATALQNTGSLVYHRGPSFVLMTILTLTTGSAFIMWLGEQISERGIGNGMSLIIFVGIVVGLPRAILN